MRIRAPERTPIAKSLHGRRALATVGSGGMANALARCLAGAGDDLVLPYSAHREWAEEVVHDVSRHADLVSVDQRRPEPADGSPARHRKCGQIDLSSPTSAAAKERMRTEAS